MTGKLVYRRAALPLLLAGALLASSGIATVGLAADADADPSPVAEATPEPTPYPAFDPAAVTLRIDLFADGLDAPVYLTDDGTTRNPENDCVYVVERGGIVRVVEPDGTVRREPFLDISSLVRVGPELGLHAIAFHPKFKKNGRFFAHYNTPKGDDTASVVAEFNGKACGKARKNKPARVLLNEVQPFPNNNGGWIGFGPDGKLFVALGDGGGRSPGDPLRVGQDAGTRLSKILRLDVDRPDGIPKDNPHAKKRKGFPREAWAMGLRDPRQASFDRNTGDMWIGDLGQDRFEEINVIAAGSVPKKGPIPNFGWSDMEGDSCHNLPECDPAQYTSPLWYYDQVSPHGGVTGGYVYRGAENPELDGIYLFSDRISGFVWGIDADAIAAGEPPMAHALLDADRGFASFGEDTDGELYLVSLDGNIYRISAEAS